MKENLKITQVRKKKKEISLLRHQFSKLIIDSFNSVMKTSKKTLSPRANIILCKKFNFEDASFDANVFAKALEITEELTLERGVKNTFHYVNRLFNVYMNEFLPNEDQFVNKFINSLNTYFNLTPSDRNEMRDIANNFIRVHGENRFIDKWKDCKHLHDSYQGYKDYFEKCLTNPL